MRACRAAGAVRQRCKGAACCAAAQCIHPFSQQPSVFGWDGHAYFTKRYACRRLRSPIAAHMVRRRCQGCALCRPCGDDGVTAVHCRCHRCAFSFAAGKRGLGSFAPFVLPHAARPVVAGRPPRVGAVVHGVQRPPPVCAFVSHHVEHDCWHACLPAWQGAAPGGPLPARLLGTYLLTYLPRYLPTLCQAHVVHVPPPPQHGDTRHRVAVGLWPRTGPPPSLCGR